MPFCFICEENCDLLTIEKAAPDGVHKILLLNSVKIKDRVVTWHTACGASVMLGIYMQRYLSDPKAREAAETARAAIRTGATKIKAVPQEFIYL